MKFAVAFTALAALAAADINTMSEISAHWDAITSIINGDLPTLSLVNPSLYAEATSVIGGTAITEAFNTNIVQQVATGISPAIMNPVLSRAGVTDVTLDGSPIPTSDSASSSSSAEASSSPTTSAESSSAEESGSSAESSGEQSASNELSDSEVEESGSGEESGAESSDEEESSSEKESTKSGAAKVAAGSVAAALVAVAALF
ncbi:hypothetical protein LPJ59_001361 [Coemansia sp. RSA 2399]|nr:hypothetical protein LPJ59_001361 [Coemansia sp. RSA 2399]KAJ1906714.1 hypothetical protein LPJ81_001200 [Coemansia sp. IMI 209127]